jgi:hypothetical protein
MAVMMPPLDERTPDPAYGEALTTCLATEMNRASRSLEKPFHRGPRIARATGNWNRNL